MTNPSGQPEQHIAAGMQCNYPSWTIVWGSHSRLYWAFPRFHAPPGTVVTAPDPSELTVQIHAAELAIATRTRLAADQPAQQPRPRPEAAITDSVSTVNPRPSTRWTVILDGHRLRQLRQQRHLTREELADRAGISIATIAKLERQVNSACRGRTLARLAAALAEPPAAITPSPAPDNTG